MADTSRGDYPNRVCCDCDRAGCEFSHWGRLVPDKKRHYFCGYDWEERREYYYKNGVAKPFPDNHICKTETDEKIT